MKNRNNPQEAKRGCSLFFGTLACSAALGAEAARPADGAYPAILILSPVTLGPRTGVHPLGCPKLWPGVSQASGGILNLEKGGNKRTT